MNNRNFDEWFSHFKERISTYKYYVDFEKVYKDVEKYKVEIAILNSLVGSKNIEEDFKKLFMRYPEILNAIPMLLAVRSSEIYVKDRMNEYLFDFNKMVYSLDDYIEFMKKTGLFDLMANHIISDLHDYVLGVDVGLDSNGRKNRGGHIMEDLVEDYIQKAGYTKDDNYFKEMYLTDVEKKWNVDLSSMSGDNVSTKRFDFVIKTDKQIYLIETNFYAANGSKLNETARSYKMLAEESKKIDGVTFMWITDGLGWKGARKNLEETFNVLPTLYNINDLDNGVFETLN